MSQAVFSDHVAYRFMTIGKRNMAGLMFLCEEADRDKEFIRSAKRYCCPLMERYTHDAQSDTIVYEEWHVSVSCDTDMVGCVRGCRSLTGCNVSRSSALIGFLSTRTGAGCGRASTGVLPGGANHMGMGSGFQMMGSTITLGSGVPEYHMASERKPLRVATLTVVTSVTACGTD